jgi:hypothetical protein
MIVPDRTESTARRPFPTPARRGAMGTVTCPSYGVPPPRRHVCSRSEVRHVWAVNNDDLMISL